MRDRDSRLREKSMLLTDSGISTAWPSTPRIMSSESLSLEIHQNEAGFVKRNDLERSASCILIRCKWNRYRVAAIVESLIEGHWRISIMVSCFQKEKKHSKRVFFLFFFDRFQSAEKWSKVYREISWDVKINFFFCNEYILRELSNMKVILIFFFVCIIQ